MRDCVKRGCAARLPVSAKAADEFMGDLRQFMDDQTWL